MELLVRVVKVNEVRSFRATNSRGETKDMRVVNLELALPARQCTLNADAIGDTAEQMLAEKMQPGDILNIDLRFNARSYDTENGARYVTDCRIFDYFKVNQGVEAF